MAGAWRIRPSWTVFSWRNRFTRVSTETPRRRAIDPDLGQPGGVDGHEGPWGGEPVSYLEQGSTISNLATAERCLPLNVWMATPNPTAVSPIRTSTIPMW